jgi:hypothetical protein
MTRSVDLRDCRTLAEAEAEVAALIDEAQETALEDFEIALIDLDRTERNDIYCELACRRAELEAVREEILDRFRALVRGDGKTLQRCCPRRVP